MFLALLVYGNNNTIVSIMIQPVKQAPYPWINRHASYSR